MLDFNWIAIGVSAVAGFLLGGIWYGPIFGKQWKAECGFSEDCQDTGDAKKLFAIVFVLNLFSATVLCHVLATYGHPAMATSVMVSAGIAIGFIIPAFAINYMFAARSMRLFLIDGGYWLSIYILMGVIFGIFS